LILKATHPSLWRRLKAVKNLFPRVKTSFDYKEIFKNKEIDAVCIASPTNTHFQLAKEALEADKHVLCEKPLALIPEECLELKDLADKIRESFKMTESDRRRASKYAKESLYRESFFTRQSGIFRKGYRKYKG